ncbi:MULTISPECIES: hypothetical protein [unclassified Nocardia]|uniref:hypothetical protein n=1 Tax=unclassified Nocardia TaxID=2637762 RepID=UPI00278C4525|nr:MULTISPECIES: hypothetical protein [unclassified Nocardia]
MTGKASRASDVRQFRAPQDLWDDYGDAVEHSPDPEADMSKVLRAFLRWYARQPGAKLPERPGPGWRDKK